jgi:hypothetical protein
MKKILSCLAVAAVVYLGACDSSTNSPAPTTPVDNTNQTPTSTVVVKLTSGKDTSFTIVAGQTQKFLFTPKVGATYLFSTVGTTNTHLELRDSVLDRTIKTDEYPSSVNGQITWVPTTAATAYILVTGDSATTAGPTTLRITTISGPDDYEPDSTLKTAVLLNPDSSLQGHTFMVGDVDWFKIPVKIGKSYKIATSGSFYSVYLQPYGADSSVLASSTSSTLSYRSTVDGFLYVKASPAYQSYTDKYSIRAWRDSVVLIGGGVDSVFNIVAGQTAEVNFTPKANATYKITTVGTTNTYLELRDNTGRTLKSDEYPSSVNGQITWTTTSTSPLTVRVSGDSATTKGPTNLVITMTSGPDDYESDNTLHTAAAIKTDSSIQNHTLTTGDEDWVKVAVTAGKNYKVAGSGDYTVYLQAFAADSTPLAASTYNLVSFNSATTGYVYVKAAFSGSYYTGKYTLRAWNDTVGVDSYESDDTRATAKSITTDGVSQSHYLQPGEHDWVKFNGEVGKNYKVSLGGFSDGNIYVYSDSNSLSYASHSYSSASIKATKSGTIFVDIYGYSTSSAGKYTVSVTVDTTSVDSYEFDDTRATAKLITTDSVAQKHTLQAGEHDWVKFMGEAGKNYKISLGGFSDGSIYVYSDSSTSSSTSHGYSSAGIKAVVSGMIFVDISGYYTTSTGPYSVAVSVDTTGIDKYEPDDTRATAQPITNDGVAQTHYLQVGEHDWMKFPVVAGYSYNVKVTGFSDGYFKIYSDSLSNSYTASGYTNIKVTAATTGTMFLDFMGVSSSYSGSYSISVTQDTSAVLTSPTVDKYESDDTKSLAKNIVVDSSAQVHNLVAGEHDWIKFDGVAGTNYTITMNNPSSSWTFYYDLYDSSSSTNYLDSDFDGVISYTPTTSGVFYLDMHGASSSSNGPYSIKVTTK